MLEDNLERVPAWLRLDTWMRLRARYAAVAIEPPAEDVAPPAGY
jgi:hypothetical protein